MVFVSRCSIRAFGLFEQRNARDSSNDNAFHSTVINYSQYTLTFSLSF